MDILQTLTVMMEENDRSKGEKVPTPQAARGETPRDPVHVSSPTKVPDSEPVALQAVVEQLYARCQLLERERLGMMETTLDLLESTGKSSKEEVEAALEMARKKTAEELFRMRKQRNHRDRETLYHKLCNSRTSKS